LFLLAEKIGVSVVPLQPVDEDPLMAAVNLLELHWISVLEVLEVTRRMLTRFFVGLWPGKKADMPTNDLKKFAAVFDTTEDPILSMKSQSVKRGTEGAIALAFAHGKEVDWEKVSSSRGRPLSELLGFFEKAKKYAPSIVSIITPSTASSTSMPVSSTPVTSGSMPPPNAGATSSAPTSAVELDAEVA
jgi:phosphate/sulfate permease